MTDIIYAWNDCVDMINMKMIGRFHGKEMVYHSFDCAVDDPHNYYPKKFLTSHLSEAGPAYIWQLN